MADRLEGILIGALLMLFILAIFKIVFYGIDAGYCG